MRSGAALGVTHVIVAGVSADPFSPKAVSYTHLDVYKRQRFVDALFTATSAVCVTGLVVHNTAAYWSVFGQVVILLLIQAGGLGIMTYATAHALVTGRRVTLKERIMIQEQMGYWSLSGLVGLMKEVILFTLVFEAVGCLLYTSSC